MAFTLLLLFFGLCTYAAIYDIRTMLIPNWLNLTLAVSFLPFCLFALPGWATLGWHFLAGTIAFVLCFLLFQIGSFGGGDAKMIPGVVLWLGPDAVLPFLMGMAFTGGPLGIIVIIARRTVPEHAIPGFAAKTLQKGKGMPYGPAIAAGALFAAGYSPLLSSVWPSV